MGIRYIENNETQQPELKIDAPAQTPTRKGIRYTEESAPGSGKTLDNFISSMKQLMQAETQAKAQQEQQTQVQASEAQRQQHVQQQVKQIQDEDPRNWSSSRFKKDFPKPRTSEEQVFYDMMLEEKKNKEAEIRKKFEGGRQLIDALTHPEIGAAQAGLRAGVPVGRAIGEGYSKAREVFSENAAGILPANNETMDKEIPINVPNPMAPVTQIPLGKTTPRKAVKELAGIGLDELATAGLGGATNLILKGAARVTGQASSLIEVLPKIVDAGIMKGVKPSSARIKNIAGLENYKKDARMAVAAIYDNRKDLGLRDEVGEVVEKLPETMHEFSSAIQSTMAKTFSRYDALDKQAGKQGATIDLKAIGKDITSNLSKSKKVLETVAPEALDYANKRATALTKAGSFTAEEAQDAIKIMNQSLESFYKNPTYDTASKAIVDAGIANAMRRALDAVIESATGRQYQVLRNIYKSLKTIEADVAKRTVAEARKSGKSLIDFSDIFSGSEIVRGLVRLDPGSVAAGTTAKGIASLYKRLNSPNQAIKMMFRKYDKAYKAVRK
jgi:hypothetical protein